MKKILVVDDDRTLRTALSRHLESQGYLVQGAESGLAAMELFEDDPPDLVVSDIVMPGIDGFEFCRRLRATRAGQLIPFIFLSCKGEVDDRIQGHHIGADDYLIKPFDMRELVAKIEAQLERSRRTHAEILRLIQSSHHSNGNGNGKAHAQLNPLPLTPAEEKVFWEVIKGFTNKQIGDRLFVSPRTVQTHLSNILSKLHLENRSQLVRYAFEQGYGVPAEETVS